MLFFSYWLIFVVFFLVRMHRRLLNSNLTWHFLTVSQIFLISNPNYPCSARLRRMWRETGRLQLERREEEQKNWRSVHRSRPGDAPVTVHSLFDLSPYITAGWCDRWESLGYTEFCLLVKCFRDRWWLAWVHLLQGVLSEAEQSFPLLLLSGVYSSQHSLPTDSLCTAQTGDAKRK